VKTAIDLIGNFNTLLDPRPAAIRIAPFAARPSNESRFRKRLNAGHLDKDNTQGGTSNRDDYGRWVAELKEKLPDDFYERHRQRIDSLVELYALAYGGIFDDFGFGESHRSQSEKDYTCMLADSVRECLISHGGTRMLAPKRISLAEVSGSGLLQLPGIRKSKSINGDVEPSKDEMLLLLSGCYMDNGDILHIPMLDFRVKPTEANLEIVSASVMALYDGPGVILNSGRSYHFYGFRLLPIDKFLEFAHRSLLLIPFIDARYIAHSLMDREFCLRITGKHPGHPSPAVVREITQSAGNSAELNQ
jgi:hypothetical protein